VPDGFVGGLEEVLPLARCPLQRAFVTRSHPTEQPPECALDEARSEGHARRKRNEKRSQRDKLRDRARTTEHTLPEPALDVANALGQRSDRARPRCDPGPLIEMSRLAQPVNSEQRVKKFQTQCGSNVTRDAGLHVGRVHTRHALRENRNETRERQRERTFREASSQQRQRVLRAGCVDEGDRDAPRHECHEGVAEGVQCPSSDEGEKFDLVGQNCPGF
jgi:hypothetical protein